MCGNRRSRAGPGGPFPRASLVCLCLFALAGGAFAADPPGAPAGSFAGFELKPGARSEVALGAINVPAGHEAVLTFKARASFDKPAGYCGAMRLIFNGQTLDASRLLNKNLEEERANGSLQATAAAELFTVAYSPDFEAVNADPAYGFKFSKACEFELRVTDLLKAEGNALLVENGAMDPHITLVMSDGRVERRPVPPGFRAHGSFKGIGACLNRLVGPGPDPGSERFYASYCYGSGFDVVAVDPLTGKAEVFSSPVAREEGAYGMVVGPDGRVYLSTCSGAHLMRLDWKERRIEDLGRPSATEQYIWELALGADKKLYGCTYPGARLVRFDPAGGKSEDLGRMDPKELYARSVAADDRGFVYTGIGMSARGLVAYEIATGQHRDILPAACRGTGACSVARGDDGRAYAKAGDQYLRLDGWAATAIPAAQHRPPPPPRLADGRLVTCTDGAVTVHDPRTGQSVRSPVDYAGKGLDIFRIGLGPDGRIYGSTAMPVHFLWADPEGEQWAEIGRAPELGSGEVYSFLACGDALVACVYGSRAPILIYRPDRPYGPKPTPDGNPWQVCYKGMNEGWRPMAMIAGPGGKAYIGSVSGYGLLGGPLSVLDPRNGQVDQYPHLVKDQSVIALAALPDGRIVGGTTIEGGGGSHRTQTEARLFVWDPEKREKVCELIPVPRQIRIDALAVGRDGLVYGFAGHKFFVFDPTARRVVETASHHLGQVIFNSLGPGPGGALYGAASGGIFTVDTGKRRPVLLASYPPGIHGGFAIRGQRLYFTSGPRIMSYALP